jgi:hypothetical protein
MWRTPLATDPDLVRILDENTFRILGHALSPQFRSAIAVAASSGQRYDMRMPHPAKGAGLDGADAKRRAL